MNEQNNIALVESLYAAFGRGDVAFILSQLSSDIEWTLEGPKSLPYAGKRRGVAEVTEFFKALGAQNGQKLTTTDIFAKGDKVATFGRYAATVPSTGKSFDSQAAHLFTIRDGKVTSFVDVVDSAAMAAAY